MSALTPPVPLLADDTLLRFPPDSAWRRALQPAAARRHPGKLDLFFLAWLAQQYIAPGAAVLDPMAGSGSALLLTLPPWGATVVCNELEPTWAGAAAATWAHLQGSLVAPTGRARVICGDAAMLPARLEWSCDALITSPPYSDAISHQRHGEDYHPDRVTGHGAQSPISRNSRTEIRQGYDPPTAGAPPPGQRNPAQIGNLAGARYTAAMQAVWAACVPLVRPGGHVLVILKNIVRRNAEVDLIGQTAAQLVALGLVPVATHYRAVRTGPFHHIRRKAHPDALIIDREGALVFEVPA